MFNLLAKDNGFVHACGHRGHSLGAPENTIAALEATLAHGGTSAEIDVMLSQDDQIVLMHDYTVDRTTNGHGLVESHTLSQLQALDAGQWFAPEFADTKVLTLEQVFSFARQKLGLVVEIKEPWRTKRLIEILGLLLESTDSYDHAIFISFDHALLHQLKLELPKIRTEAITHERFVDPVGVLKAAQVDSVSIELEMFDPEQAQKIHQAGIAIRLHLPRPAKIQFYQHLGKDIEPQLGAWLKAGLVDCISGDDVGYLAQQIKRFRFPDSR